MILKADFHLIPTRWQLNVNYQKSSNFTSQKTLLKKIFIFRSTLPYIAFPNPALIEEWERAFHRADLVSIPQSLAETSLFLF